MGEARIVKFKGARAEVTLTGDRDLTEKFKQLVPAISREWQPKRTCWRVDRDCLERVRELFIEEAIDFGEVLG